MVNGMRMRERHFLACLAVAGVLGGAACSGSRNAVPAPSTQVGSGSNSPGAGGSTRPASCAAVEGWGIVLLDAEKKAPSATPEQKQALRVTIDSALASVKAAVPEVSGPADVRTKLRKDLLDGKALTEADKESDKTAYGQVDEWTSRVCN